MNLDYFITKFTDGPHFSHAWDLCNEDEKDSLICLLGTHTTAICTGQLDYNKYGTTPKERLLGVLLNYKAWSIVK